MLVDAPRAGWVVDQLGEEAVVERRPDGAVVVSLPVVNRAAFRSWVVDLLDHAEVLSPPELRADMVGVARRGRGESHGAGAERTPRRRERRMSRPLVGPRLAARRSRWCRGSSPIPA